MYTYNAYGLSIRSTLPLPELVAGAATQDVSVRLGRVERTPEDEAATANGGRFRATAAEVYLRYEAAGTFLMRGGDEMIVDPVPGVEAEILRAFLLGPALALLLHQRGQLVLHASAVAIHGAAFAFAGWKGWGKSTTAAALHARGRSIVADDIVAVSVRGAERPMVLPGFPQFKLFPDAAAALGDVPERLSRLHTRSEKRLRRATHGFPSAPLHLRRIYVLAEDTQPEIERLPPQAALVELIRHSYVARLLQITGTVASHFYQCAQLVNRVPICRLKRPRDLAALPAVAEMVEQDVAGEL